MKTKPEQVQKLKFIQMIDALRLQILNGSHYEDGVFTVIENDDNIEIDVQAFSFDDKVSENILEYLTEYHLQEGEKWTAGIYSFKALLIHNKAQCSFPNEGVQNDFEAYWDVEYFECELMSHPSNSL